MRHLDEFSPDWQFADFHVGISRTLAKHNCKGFGEYQFRYHREAQERYMVRGTGDGVHWTYCIVDVRRETVERIDSASVEV